MNTKQITDQSIISAPGQSRLSTISRWFLLIALLTLSELALAQAQWSATVGAQSSDKGGQALAFLPNEIWIHAGDRITWHFAADEIHTLTFLRANQARPFFADGCPGFSTSPATFDGSTCVTTPPLVSGGSFTVIFPAAGNFKLTCLVHENMTGAIHVLPLAQPLPHNQAFYDSQATAQGKELLADARREGAAVPTLTSSRAITAGVGEVRAKAGGSSTASVLRFSSDNMKIRAGQTIEWNNEDPVTPHTITFGTEPANLVPPSPDVTVDPDGARHAIIAATTDNTHSGFPAST